MKIAVLNFFLAAVIGAMLRLAFVTEIPGFNYRYFLHAHSHTALLGWLFSAYFILVVFQFNLQLARYRWLFWSLQGSVFGMLISFPIQGYGLFSILFSSLHIILTYIFVVQVIGELWRKNEMSNFSSKLLITALIFLVLASIGTWALGIIMNSPLRGSAWYYASIQFFLHFQFNGWLIFGLLALFFQALSNFAPFKKTQDIRFFYLFLVLSCIMTYALAVTWSTPDKFLFWTNSLGVIIQLAAWIIFSYWVFRHRTHIRTAVQPTAFILWTLAFACLTIKIVIQSLVAIPAIAVISYTIHNFVIGFIHLLMLGGISLFIFGLLYHFEFWSTRLTSMTWGIRIFIAGVVLTEGLLFYQGMRLWMSMGFIPNYHLVLFLLSMLLPAGLAFILTDLFRTRNKLKPS